MNLIDELNERSVLLTEHDLDADDVAKAAEEREQAIGALRQSSQVRVTNGSIRHKQWQLANAPQELAPCCCR